MSNLKINVEELKDLIKEELEFMEMPGCLTTEVVIGKIMGVQIQIKLTRDPDELLDDDFKTLMQLEE